MSYVGRIQWDGSFTIANVPPGRYTLRARGGDEERQQYADQPLSVAGGEVAGIVVSLARGATYHFYLYAYTRTHRNGVIIGHTTWTER